MGQISGLEPCSQPHLCPSTSLERHTPPPAFHVHIEGTDVKLGLYVQSETLWFLPPLDQRLLTCDEGDIPSHFALASDQTVFRPWRPGRGYGAFDAGQDPVIVPRPHVLLEAYLRLYARDAGNRIGAFGMAMIAYMEEYVDDDGLLDASRLPEPLRTFYAELREGKKPVRQWKRELQEALGVPRGDSGGDSS